jgi:hypothetical protein
MKAIVYRTYGLGERPALGGNCHADARRRSGADPNRRLHGPAGVVPDQAVWALRIRLSTRSRDSGFYEYLRVPTAQPTEPTGRLLEQQRRTVEPVTAKNIGHLATEGITGAAQRHYASHRTLV